MIEEQTLEALLGEVADGVELPGGGCEAALAGMRAPMQATGRRQWLPTAVSGIPVPAVAAGLVVAVIAVSATFLVAGHHSGSGSSAPSSRVAHTAAGAAQAYAGNALDKGRYTAPAVTPVPEGTSAPSTSSGTTTASGALASPRVVRTATVALQVKATAVGSTLTRLSALAAGDGGYVQDSTSSLAGKVPSGSMTLRIPSAGYGRARDALAGGGYGTVESLQEQGTDVTAQYTDLGARLDALTATRASYLALLGRAGTIPDVLAVQAQLSSVQQQIESLQGQLKVLADTSDDATIAVSVSAPPLAAPPAHHRSGWAVAVSRAGHGLVHDLEAIVARSGGALVAVVALLVAGALVLTGMRLIRRRLI